ncbi:MAG: GNAT family protein [Anaerolineales bacterium]
MNPLLLDLPTEFTSERLRLRCYHTDDSSMYFQMLRTNREHLYEFLPASLMAVQSEPAAEAVIRRLMADWNARNLFIFGVWEKESGLYVGESYLANPDWEVPRIEVGYFIVQASTGKGYATEAARATVRFAFEHLGVVRVELQCAADNQASLRVAEHCGFVFEGRFRQRHRKKSGYLVDMLWYGLLLSEWQHSRTSQGTDP